MDHQANMQEIYNIPDSGITKDWIQGTFAQVVENPNVDEATISQYYSQDFIQRVDGHTLNYHDFVNHMKALRDVFDTLKITIERCMIQGNSYFTIHRADGVKKNGEKVVARVIAYYEVKDGKITLCDELVKILVGEKEDEDLGSRK